MPRCRRCGEEKDIRKFQTKRRVDGSLWVGPTCDLCVERDRQPDPRLPAWPFRFWLHERLSHYAVYAEPNDLSKLPGYRSLIYHCSGPDTTPENVERWFHHVRTDNRSVKLDAVDRVLLNEGSTMLWELVEMAEEHVLSNGYSFDQVLRRLSDLEEWKRWA